MTSSGSPIVLFILTTYYSASRFVLYSGRDNCDEAESEQNSKITNINVEVQQNSTYPD